MLYPQAQAASNDSAAVEAQERALAEKQRQLEESAAATAAMFSRAYI